MASHKLDELAPMQLSVLTEIGNIGSGNAATALAGLLNTTVDIEIPTICLMDYNKVADYLGGPDNMAIGITVGVEGDLNGTMLQVAEKEFAHRLINTFYPTEMTDFNNITDMDMSVLREVANITTAAYVNSIAKMTGTFINIAPPKDYVDTIRHILELPSKEYENLDYQVLFIDERLRFANTHINCAMILILDISSMKVLFKKLGITL